MDTCEAKPSIQDFILFDLLGVSYLFYLFPNTLL
jgi:hypothetical protein